MLFCVWLLSLNMVLRFVHVVACFSVYSCLLPVVFHFINLLIHSLLRSTCSLLVFFFFLVSIFDYHKHSCTSLCEGIYILYFLTNFYSYLAVLGLCCCTGAFGEQGLTLCSVCRLLIAMACLVEEHGL